MRVAVLVDEASLDPQRGGAASPVRRALFQSLTRIGPDGVVEAAAATHWETSPDGLEWRFHLRPDLKWSDGTPLTAADFVHGLRRLVDPLTASGQAAAALDVKGAGAIIRGEAPPETLGARAEGAHLLVIELETPNALGAQLMSEVFPAPVHLAGGSDWAEAKSFVGNGPYILAERIPSTKIVMERNANFGGGAPAEVQKVSVFVLDGAGLLGRYRAGEIDLAGPLPSSMLRRMPKERRSETLQLPSTAIFYLALNLKKPPLDNPRLRGAIAAAVDRDMLLKPFEGFGNRPAFTMLAPALHADDTIAATPPAAMSGEEGRNLASEALAGLGYSKEKPLRLTLSQIEGSNVTVPLQRLFAEIGIKLRIRTADAAAHEAAASVGDFDLSLHVMGGLPIADPLPYLRLLGPGGDLNYASFTSADYERLLEEAARAATIAERFRLARAAEAELLASHAVIPLVQTADRFLIAPHLSGWRAEMGPTDYARLRIAAP